MTSMLYHQIKKPSELNTKEKTVMYFLMQQFYIAHPEDVFIKDLFQKQYVILVNDGKSIQGFSTIAINPLGTGTRDYNVFFSGDTIIHPDYWGDEALIKGFFHLLTALNKAEPHKKMYWFLISKGHRTYLYLPLFFKRYYPAVPARQNPNLVLLLNQIATLMFGQYWDPNTGLICMPHDYPLKENLSESVFQAQSNNEHIRFFLARNPDFGKAIELACLAEVCKENFLPLTEQYYQTALNLESPL